MRFEWINNSHIEIIHSIYSKRLAIKKWKGKHIHSHTQLNVEKNRFNENMMMIKLEGEPINSIGIKWKFSYRLKFVSTKDIIMCMICIYLICNYLFFYILHLMKLSIRLNYIFLYILYLFIYPNKTKKDVNDVILNGRCWYKPFCSVFIRTQNKKEVIFYF